MSCTWDAHVEKRTKTTKFQMSNQHLGVDQLLGVIPNCWPTKFFLHEPYMSISYAWWKRYFFWMFFILFDHANACASMQEIHNRSYLKKKHKSSVYQTSVLFQMQSEYLTEIQNLIAELFQLNMRLMMYHVFVAAQPHWVHFSDWGAETGGKGGGEERFRCKLLISS